jgi:hypothetical protein
MQQIKNLAENQKFLILLLKYFWFIVKKMNVRRFIIYWCVRDIQPPLRSLTARFSQGSLLSLRLLAILCEQRTLPSIPHTRIAL